MSITDVAAGRMVPQAALASRTFGMRRTPPCLANPRPGMSFDWSSTQSWLVRLQSRLATRLQILALTLKPRPREAWSREAAIRALLYSDFSATSVRVFAYLGALGMLAIGSAEIFRSAPAASGIEPAPRVEWIDVAKPFPAFALPMSELADSKYSYGMRRHATGGGRQDIMSWGDMPGAAPHLMVEIYRPAMEFTHFGSAQEEIAARIEGLVSPLAIKAAGSMETKFGSMSLVEFTVSQEPARHCLGFVRPFDYPRLQILGWYCTNGPELIERDLTACALDRLTLLAAGSDAKVGEMFARAELKRTFCGQRSPLFAATPKLGPSAALGPETKLRGRLSAH